MKKRSFSIALLVLVAFTFVLFMFNIVNLVKIQGSLERAFGEERIEGGVSLAPPYDYYRVFVSSQTYNGSLGGVSGANQICQNLANTVSLGGNWSAWISDSTSSPSQSFFNSTIPYKLVNGNMVALNWLSLTNDTNPSYSLINGIDYNEYGNQIFSSIPLIREVMTATQLNGSYISSAGDCNQWNSSSNSLTYNFIGGAGITDSSWTLGGLFSVPFTCANYSRIYCFEQPWCGNGIKENAEQCDDGNTNNGDACKNDCSDNVCGDGSVYIGVEQCDDNNTDNGDGCDSTCKIEPHYKVFISSVQFQGNIGSGPIGGMQFADNNCNLLAKMANLNGTWKAWMSNSTLDAKSRLYHSLINYALVGGNGSIVIANNWSDLTEGSLINKINCNELGNCYVPFPLGSPIYVWTGTTEYGNTGRGDCRDWNSYSSLFTGTVGNANAIDNNWSNINEVSCDNSAYLYCFEQPWCGNKIIDGSETCDDGNSINGDGCSSSCVIESSGPGPNPGGGGNNGGGGGGGGTPTVPQCRDKKDNDNDGKIDYPNDPGCLSAEDTSEYNVPIAGCTENWRCVPIGECINGTQRKQCADLNNCGTNINKPSLEEECVETKVGTGTEDPARLEAEKRRTLGSILIILMVVSTFVTILLIVSMVIRETSFIKQVNRLSNTGVSSQTAIEKKEKMIEKIENKQALNVQVATFLIFVLSIIYYVAYAFAFGIASTNYRVSLSPGVLPAVSSLVFNISILTFLLALIVFALGGKKIFEEKK